MTMTTTTRRQSAVSASSRRSSLSAVSEAGGSDLDLTADELTILIRDADHEFRELQLKELELSIQLDAVRRDLRAARQEKDYLRTLRTFHRDDGGSGGLLSEAELCEAGMKPEENKAGGGGGGHRYQDSLMDTTDLRLTTLTLRRKSLLLERFRAMSATELTLSTGGNIT